MYYTFCISDRETRSQQQFHLTNVYRDYQKKYTRITGCMLLPPGTSCAVRLHCIGTLVDRQEGLMESLLRFLMIIWKDSVLNRNLVDISGNI